MSVDAKIMDFPAGEVYDNGYKPREYLWGAELTKEKPTSLWSFNEDEEGEDSTDKDFLIHTLALKYAMLGVDTNAERHVIEVETKTYEGETIKLPLAILTKDKQEMMPINLIFTSEHPVEFRLVSGSGPVCLLGQHYLEYPAGTVDDDEESQYETEASDAEAEEEVTTVLPKSKKRKASVTPKAVKNKKTKLESMDTADLDDEDDSDSDGEGEEDIETPPETVSNSSSEEEDIKKKRRGPARKGAAKETKAPAGKKVKETKVTPAKGNQKKQQRKSK